MLASCEVKGPPGAGRSSRDGPASCPMLPVSMRIAVRTRDRYVRSRSIWPAGRTVKLTVRVPPDGLSSADDVPAVLMWVLHRVNRALRVR